MSQNPKAHCNFQNRNGSSQRSCMTPWLRQAVPGGLEVAKPLIGHERGGWKLPGIASMYEAPTGRETTRYLLFPRSCDETIQVQYQAQVDRAIRATAKESRAPGAHRHIVNMSDDSGKIIDRRAAFWRGLRGTRWVMPVGGLRLKLKTSISRSPT